MKRILVPCDFSDHALQAFKFAIDIATKSQGEILVLKVNDLPFSYERTFGVQPSWHDPALVFELAEQSKKDYERMKGLYPEASVPIEFLIERGPVSPTIQKTIKEKHIDLVVMGKQGANGLQELLVGSNAVKTVRSSPVPVIAVGNAPDLSSITNIVFPSTLSLKQHDLIDKIQAIQDFFSATLHVVLINTPEKFMRDREANELLEEYAKFYKLKNYTLNFRNDLHEHHGIINFTREIKADMIVMRTHGRRGISHLFNGSIAEDVLVHVDCPVWTFVIKS